MTKLLSIRTERDDEAEVWGPVERVLGLVIDAHTLEMISSKFRAMEPQMVADNNYIDGNHVQYDVPAGKVVDSQRHAA